VSSVRFGSIPSRCKPPVSEADSPRCSRNSVGGIRQFGKSCDANVGIRLDRSHGALNKLASLQRGQFSLPEIATEFAFDHQFGTRGIRSRWGAARHVTSGASATNSPASPGGTTRAYRPLKTTTASGVRHHAQRPPGSLSRAAFGMNCRCISGSIHRLWARPARCRGGAKVRRHAP
jgi:hypothetical protein